MVERRFEVPPFINNKLHVSCLHLSFLYFVLKRHRTAIMQKNTVKALRYKICNVPTVICTLILRICIIISTYVSTDIMLSTAIADFSASEKGARYCSLMF